MVKLEDVHNPLARITSLRGRDLSNEQRHASLADGQNEKRKLGFKTPGVLDYYLKCAGAFSKMAGVVFVLFVASGKQKELALDTESR